MNYSLLSQNATGTIFDITTLAGTITHATYIDGQPSKLTFTLQDDPAGLLELSCGNVIRFMVDDVGVFYGYIFTVGTDRTGDYRVTAYDQLRYLKNKEVYVTSGMTASQIFERVCSDVLPPTGLKQYEVVTPSSFIVPEYLHEGKTLYEIISYGIQRANVNEGKYYFIKDKFGVIQFTELGRELTTLIVGDGSLLTDYQYEASIDKNTHNQVKVYRDNKETGKRDVWMVLDSDTQAKWGLLQMLVKAPDEYNEAQIQELASRYMALYNRETRTMKLSTLGQKEIQAGSGFVFALDKLNIRKNMWVQSATHTYEKDYHTMSLEVFM